MRCTSLNYPFWTGKSGSPGEQFTFIPPRASTPDCHLLYTYMLGNMSFQQVGLFLVLPCLLSKALNGCLTDAHGCHFPCHFSVRLWDDRVCESTDSDFWRQLKSCYVSSKTLQYGLMEVWPTRGPKGCLTLHGICEHFVASRLRLVICYHNAEIKKATRKRKEERNFNSRL